MPQNRGRRRPARSGKARRMLVNLLLLNALPLGVGAVLVVMWMRGEIEEFGLPPGMGETLAVIGIALGGLILVANLLLRFTHAAVTSVARTQRRCQAVRRGELEGNRFGAVLGWTSLVLPRVVLEGLRLLFVGAAFALIGVIVVYTVRLFRPEFLQPQIDAVVAWAQPTLDAITEQGERWAERLRGQGG